MPFLNFEQLGSICGFKNIKQSQIINFKQQQFEQNNKK